MKLTKLLPMLTLGALVTGGIIYAADHADSPTVTGATTDITDVYVFQGQNTSNMVFVGSTQGVLSPSATGAAKFDPNTLIQFSIDNTGDNVEDLVIQALYDATTNKMNFYGPVKPSATGIQSKLEGAVTASVAVTAYGSTAVTATQGGMTVFAGPRDDPFFFDLDQFKKVVGGTATGFNKPGKDFFAGTNVLSVIAEIPKSMLNAPSSGAVSVWMTTRKKI
jgi:Domain of unknown function (DUF4331)